MSLNYHTLKKLSSDEAWEVALYRCEYLFSMSSPRTKISCWQSSVVCETVNCRCHCIVPNWLNI